MRVFTDILEKLGRERLALGILLIAGIALRFAFINLVSADAQYYLLPWFNELANGAPVSGRGLVDAFGQTNANYAPPYYYLLWLVTHFSGVLPSLWLIKFVSFGFDLLGAFFAYKIVRLHFSERRALLAAALVFAAPTAIFNDGWFGQCDMIWTSLLLGSLYFALQRKMLLALVVFAVAFSFKAQAIFFAPFLFMMFVRGEIKIWSFGVIPLVYAAMMVPAVLGGDSWLEVATTYVRQGNVYHRLSMHAPNLYYFFADNFYKSGVPIGLAVTAIACFALAVLPRLKNATLDAHARVLAATMFVALAPFLMPKMHDRYFFAADMMSIILALYIPRLWVIPIGFQISSLGAYVPMLSVTFHRIFTATMPTAVLLNTALVGYLVYEYCRLCAKPAVLCGDKLKLLVIAASAVIAANCVWEAAAVVEQLLAAKICKGSSSFICASKLPRDWVQHGSLVHWAAFALILVGCVYGIHWLIARSKLSIPLA